MMRPRFLLRRYPVRRITLTMTDTTINPDEIAKFAAMADEWWDPKGKFKPLHKFNPVRLGYVRDKVIGHFGKDGTVRRPLEGVRILDIGCGGGLLSEPLARLGASMVGIDAGDKNIRIAEHHAAQSGLEIDYRETTSEALAAAAERFDIVLNMEVVEHVSNVPLYMKSCADLVVPGGLLVSATINRTARALAFAKFAAEYVLRWLPRGTHQFGKLVRPEELEKALTNASLAITDRSGVTYNPLADRWHRSKDMDVNYMVLAEKGSV